MRISLIHPFGSPFAFQAALALHEQRWLAQFHTCLFNPLRSGHRYFPALVGGPLSLHQSREFLRLASTLLPFPRWNGRRNAAVDSVGSWCDRQASRQIAGDLTGVYAYEDFAAHSFEQSRSIGAAAIYDLPICFHTTARALTSLEAERDPALKAFLQSLNEPEPKILRKEREIALATHIICASSFTRDSIPTPVRNSAPVSVIPYGVDPSPVAKRWTRSDNAGRLNLIFVGSIGPRKGVHVLFEALDKVARSAYKLTLAGRWVPGFEQYLKFRFSVNYEYVGQIRHEALPELYSRHHVLVFPSLAEGFGLVLLEAMASGIPVITTERTAGPDLLPNGGGYLVRAGDVVSLVACLDHILSRRHEIADMAQRARQVASFYSWQRYRSELVKALSGSSGDTHLQA